MRLIYKAKLKHEGWVESFPEMEAEHPAHVWRAIRKYANVPSGFDTNTLKSWGWRVDRVYDPEPSDIQIGIAIAKKVGITRFLGNLLKGIF